MKNNKMLLFATIGAMGGAAGALAAEIVPDFGRGGVGSVLETGCWSGVFAAVLTVFLFWAVEIYGRRPRMGRSIITKALASGAGAGVIAGAIAQAVYSVHMDDDRLRELALKPLCWGLMGVLLGWRFSTVIPNLGIKRGVVAGAIGGTIGGLGFIGASALIPELLGRMIGVAILGMALGIAIVAVETLFREAALEVIWAPNETTTVTLGSTPITIGGGDDHIYVAQLPPSAAAVVLDSGGIRYIDKRSGRTTQLRNGSRLNIGKITIALKAVK